MTTEPDTCQLRPADAPARHRACVPGPFGPDRDTPRGPGLLGTSLLVIYPVVATVVIVISGVMLAGSSMAV